MCERGPDHLDHRALGSAVPAMAEMMVAAEPYRVVMLLITLADTPAAVGDVLDGGVDILVSHQQAWHTAAVLFDHLEAMFL